MTRTLWIVEDADKGPQLYRTDVERDDALGGWVREYAPGKRLTYLDGQMGNAYHLDGAAALRAYGALLRQRIDWLRREVEQTEARLRVLARRGPEREEGTR